MREFECTDSWGRRDETRRTCGCRRADEASRSTVHVRSARHRRSDVQVVHTADDRRSARKIAQGSAEFALSKPRGAGASGGSRASEDLRRYGSIRTFGATGRPSSPPRVLTVWFDERHRGAKQCREAPRRESAYVGQERGLRDAASPSGRSRCLQEMPLVRLPLVVEMCNE